MEKLIEEVMLLQETTDMPLEDILRSVLSRYHVTPKKNDLMVVDNSWQAHLRLYIEKKTLAGLRVKTLKQYTLILSRALQTINKQTKDISTTDIEKYLAFLQHKSDASKRYMEMIRITLNGFFTWAEKMRIVERNPMDDIDKIKFVGKRVPPFTEEEVEKLRLACDKSGYKIRNRAIVELFYSSGIRCFELIALNRDDIDLDDKEGIIRDGKGGKQRNFFFSDIAAYYIRQYIDTRTDDNPALFISRNHDRFSDDTGVEYLLSELGKSAGVKGVRPHRFRHTFIQHCIDKGMDIEDTMLVVGHSNISTTKIYYEDNLSKTKEVYKRLFN